MPKIIICPYLFSFAVVMEEISLRLIEPHLFRNSLYIASEILPFLKINSSQYSVSKHSFKEISSLFIKSALLCAYFASCIFPFLFYRYVASQLDICSQASNRYISRFARNSICCALRNECRYAASRVSVTSLALSFGQRISSALAPYRAEGYIE